MAFKEDLAASECKVADLPDNCTKYGDPQLGARVREGRFKSDFIELIF
jgi:hypothetical protein